ncbi:hypothetical protein [Clostridium pasteurianum]|nr:hypothetical protein [Clostridium pasteurianum]
MDNIDKSLDIKKLEKKYKKSYIVFLLKKTWGIGKIKKTYPL